MKTVRSFGLSIALHAAVAAGAILFFMFFKEEKEEEIILELSLSTPIQESVPKTLGQPNLPQYRIVAEKSKPTHVEQIPKEFHREIPIENKEPLSTVSEEQKEVHAEAEVSKPEQPIQRIAQSAAPAPLPVVEQKDIQQQYLDDHLSTIRTILIKNRKYPSHAVRLKQEGDVKVSFRLRQNGEVEEIRIVGSSGYEILDDDAVALIQKSAAYFPKPPKTVRITVPLNYSLKTRMI